MAKEVVATIKLQIEAGQASPAPPVGPALGQHNVAIMDFVRQFNDKTGKMEAGTIIPVIITVFKDRSFTFVLKSPPASYLLKKACGIAKGSGTPNQEKVGKVTQKQLEEIAKMKMPDLNGIEAAFQILSELPEVKIIALSMYCDRRFVINMLKAGAHGYLLKDCAFEELSQAIRVVMENKTYLSAGVAEIIVKEYVQPEPPPEQTAFSTLTPREREVLQLVAEGKSTSQIGELLYIGVKTVETHRWQIMQKLGIKNIAQLTKYAIREGLTPLEA